MKYSKKLNIARLALVIASGFLITNLSLATPANNYKNRSPNNTEAAKDFVRDSRVTLDIYNKYIESPMLSPFDIYVGTTGDGDVTLSGEIRTDAKRKEAIRLAKAVRGVRNVNADNLLVIPSDQPMSDSWITAKAMMVLFREGLSSGISVETKNGAVYLSGKAQKGKADRVAHLIKGIEGVASVNNNLELA